MKLPAFIGNIQIRTLIVPFWMVNAFYWGLMLGRCTGADEERARHQCHSTDTRPCAFGPGIVGRQECSWFDEWRRCEPDPKYRVPAEASP
jgi:hypothetical protein